MGGCQNDGPFLDPYYNTEPNIFGTQKGTIILTTTHIILEAHPPDFESLYKYGSASLVPPPHEGHHGPSESKSILGSDRLGATNIVFTCLMLSY